MYPQQYPQISQAPPPYQNNKHANEPSVDYFRPAEERMADFQQLVARYESEFNYNTRKFRSSKEKNLFLFLSS